MTEMRLRVLRASPSISGTCDCVCKGGEEGACTVCMQILPGARRPVALYLSDLVGWPRGG